jgi:hypothetical protein
VFFGHAWICTQLFANDAMRRTCAFMVGWCESLVVCSGQVAASTYLRRRSSMMT